MNLRLLPAALLCVTAPAAFCQNPAHNLPESAPSVRLKPFQAEAAGKRTLAGVWRGTFIFNRQSDGAREEVSYRVEIAPDLSTLSVTALPPFSSDPESRTAPITESPVPADWDGELLRARSFSRTETRRRNGKEEVLIRKSYILRPGRDGRHAGVSYQVTVQTNQPRSEHTNTVSGTGELVRER